MIILHFEMLVCKQIPKKNVQLVNRPSENATVDKVLLRKNRQCLFVARTHTLNSK